MLEDALVDQPFKRKLASRMQKSLSRSTCLWTFAFDERGRIEAALRALRGKYPETEASPNQSSSLIPLLAARPTAISLEFWNSGLLGLSQIAWFIPDRSTYQKELTFSGRMVKVPSVLGMN